MFKEFESKPKTIEAAQFTNENKDRIFNELTGQYSPDFEDGRPVLKVMTMHGDMAIVRLGDWIAKETTLGCYYPIADSAFQASYGIKETQ